MLYKRQETNIAMMSEKSGIVWKVNVKNSNIAFVRTMPEKEFLKAEAPAVIRSASSSPCSEPSGLKLRLRLKPRTINNSASTATGTVGDNNNCFKLVSDNSTPGVPFVSSKLFYNSEFDSESTEHGTTSFFDESGASTAPTSVESSPKKTKTRLSSTSDPFFVGNSLLPKTTSNQVSKSFKPLTIKVRTCFAESVTYRTRVRSKAVEGNEHMAHKSLVWRLKIGKEPKLLDVSVKHFKC